VYGSAALPSTLTPGDCSGLGLTPLGKPLIIAVVKRGAKATLWILFGLAFLAASTYSMIGIYVKAPKDAPPAGATLVYNRRGTGLPFLSSPDSQGEKRRGVVNPEFMTTGPRDDRVIFRLPFNKKLYLKTTGNVEFLK
jgi:hypothetical protein